MKYLLFKKALEQFPVFSVQDIRKQFNDFDSRRLVEWQEKGYIIKLRRGYYCFEEVDKGEAFRYFSANKLFSPYYISMESGQILILENYSQELTQLILTRSWENSKKAID